MTGSPFSAVQHTSMAYIVNRVARYLAEHGPVTADDSMAVIPPNTGHGWESWPRGTANNNTALAPIEASSVTCLKLHLTTGRPIRPVARIGGPSIGGASAKVAINSKQKFKARIA